MRTDSLGVYLNDHLAGSTGALELLDHLLSQYGETSIGPQLTSLQTEISEDQKYLRSLLERLEIPERRSGQALAWLGEKVARLKLRAAGASDADLQLLEGMEALALGIQGKAALCRALLMVCKSDPRLSEDELTNLLARSMDQFSLAEGMRVTAAVSAFGDKP